MDAFISQLSNVIVWGLIVWFVIAWIRRKRKRKVESDAKNNAQRLIPEARKKLPVENNQTTMAALGATQGDRFKRIEEIFNRKTDSIAFNLKDPREEGTPARVREKGLVWDDTGTVEIPPLKGRLLRSIAAMSGRERESLRAAYHLYNIEELDPPTFYWTRFALIFGDGKAQASDFSFPSYNGIPASFPDAVKRQLEANGISAESAVSTIVDKLQGVIKRQPGNSTVKLLAGLLLGGGEAVLSATGEFVGAHDGGGKPSLILGIAEDTGKLVTFAGEGSAITIAPPGSGKTQCHVFPTLLTWKGPAVVLDVKGEIYADTSKWRKENVGPVYKFAPLDPATSHCYNPLSAVRSDPDYLWEDSRFLADMMLVPTQSKDPFWENRARDVLTAAIARACLTDDPAKRSLGDVLDIFHGVGWDPFVRHLQSRVDIRSLSRAGSSLGEMERKTRDGVLQTGLSSLSAWDGERIARVTRKSDWSPLDLRSGTNPTIYICLRPNEVESYISMLRVFIAQHIRMLTSVLPPRDATPILFVLDELPRLRQMPPVEEALEIGRQYGIKLWMFTQSLGQLENAYPNAEGMVGSCALRMYMNPSLHDGTAQKISEDIGFQESVLDGQRQKIVEPPVLGGPEYKDFVIVMASGFKPFRLQKSFAYKDAMLQARRGSL